MSIELMTAVRKLDVTPCGKKFVLFALADYADEAGSCWPSMETLATYTGQSVRAVKRHVQALEDDGFIQRARTRNNAGQLGQYRYKIHQGPIWPEANLTRGQNVQKPEANLARHNHQTSSKELEPLEGKQASKRGSRIKIETLPESWEAFAIENGLTREGAQHEFAKFRDHFLSVSGQRAIKTDWLATWRNWIRNSAQYGRRPSNADAKLANAASRRDAWLDAIDENQP